MIELARTVRFCLNDHLAQTAQSNTFSSWPAMRGLGRYYELQVHCVGEPNPQTGYFMNIKEIDLAVRTHVLPFLQQQIADHELSATIPMGHLMQAVIERLQPPLNHSVTKALLRLNPFYSLTIESNAMSHITLYQQFEFAAAHRLHVAELSDAENRDIFGKCNNRSGHGHNYQVEVAVCVPIGAEGQVLWVEKIDEIVERSVIEKLDHKHLNLDVPQFQQLNPSVENIAKIIFEMLTNALSSSSVALEEVTVWETAKTRCTYRGEVASIK